MKQWKVEAAFERLFTKKFGEIEARVLAFEDSANDSYTLESHILKSGKKMEEKTKPRRLINIGELFTATKEEFFFYDLAYGDAESSSSEFPPPGWKLKMRMFKHLEKNYGTKKIILHTLEDVAQNHFEVTIFCSNSGSSKSFQTCEFTDLINFQKFVEDLQNYYDRRHYDGGVDNE